jgi:signal transduction histidine kinase
MTGRLIALDCLAVVFTVALVLSIAGARPPSHGPAAPVWADYLVAAAAAAAIAVRRLWPLPAFGAILITSIASLFLGIAIGPFLAAAFALYAVAVSQRKVRGIPASVIGAVSIAGVLGVSLASSPYLLRSATGQLAFGAVVMGGAWTIGSALRARRMHAEQAARQRAEQAVAEERLRIARELHDVVAHSMGLITVKAGVANHVMAARPGEAQDALRVIETTSRTALTEMRHLLGVLRSDDPADLRPAPGLRGLRGLAEQAGMAGVEVRMDVSDERPLPEGVELSIYRIVQEALTNVAKHAAPARCTVIVQTGERDVKIEVTDDGRGGLVQPGGHGLIGMRERVMMYGGRVTAGPRPGGGFRVSAWFPYEPPFQPGGARA